MWRIIVFLSVLLLSIACERNSTSDTIPASLAGVPLQEKMSGEEAARITSKLQRDIPVSDESTIGYYGKETAVATLYRSRFGSDVEAQGAARGLLKFIGSNPAGAWTHRSLKVENRAVEMVEGEKQVHYVFVRDRTVTWLAVEQPYAVDALAQLLNVPPATIPGEN